MSFSSGTFSLAAGNPVVTGTTISSTTQNNTMSDVATGLSTCLLKDGTQTATAAIPFITGVTTTSTTFAVFNTTATTINAFGAASVALNMGHASGTATLLGTWSFSGTVNATSPAFTTSFTTASTTFTALAGATTLLTIGGTGATASVAIPGTLDSSSISTGSLRTAGGLGVTKALWVGGLANIAGAITAQSTVNKVTITAPAASATLTLADGSSLVTSGANSITLTSTGATNVTLPTSGTLRILTLATEQASTSGTSIDFTSIPSGVRHITIMFVGVSTSGTSNFLIQIGDAGGIEAATYTSVASTDGGTRVTSTAGLIVSSSIAAAATHTGKIVLDLENSAAFTWVSQGLLADSSPVMNMSAGSKSLDAELDRLRITMVNGSDTFDAGAINILYE